MTFAEFSAANAARNISEFKNDDSDYNAVDWALMIAAEVGEIADAVMGMLGKKKRKAHLTKTDVGREIGDVVAYCDCLATNLGLDLGTIVAAKFNEVSARIGSKVTIPVTK